MSYLPNVRSFSAVALLDLIASKVFVRASEIQAAFSLTATETSVRIAELEAIGLVSCVGPFLVLPE